MLPCFNITAYSLFLLLWGRAVDSDNNGVVSLVGFECDLLLRLHLLRLHFLDLAGKNSLGFGCRVDTIGLDGDDEMAAVLQEVGGVDGDNTSLEWKEVDIITHLFMFVNETLLQT
jgi:hypothetical protein